MDKPTASSLQGETLATQVGEMLRARRLTLAVAESCTGGGLGDTITDVAGSSDYFLGGVIVYAYSIKERLLAVPHDLLEAYGAVSSQVATAMAANVRQLLQADLALAVTGIAGPGGGTAEKPAGMVYIALATPKATQWRQYIWHGSRRENKQASVRAALQWLLDYLSDRELT